MNDSKGHTPAAETASPSGRNTLLKRCVKILAWIAGIWLGLLLIMQIVLSPSILNSIIDRYASDFIDGDLEFKRVKVEMFRHFPNAGISIEEGALTYPADAMIHWKTPVLKAFCYMADAEKKQTHSLHSVISQPESISLPF